MGIRNGRRFVKFYQQQLEDAQTDLVTFIRSLQSGMTAEQYFMMMEELGEEPKPEEIPPRFEDLLAEAQEAWQIYQSLQDIWEGMSGTFMGKNKAGMFDLFRVYEVENVREVMSLVSTIENEYMKYYMEKQKSKKH
ncbi:MAG TPA: hypothetical protein EYP92_09715 [Candidatus Thioglobus sp.]|nr:hypothetical protein [Candidatus Thioglobus sp.]